jgi:hypothetical protein
MQLYNSRSSSEMENPCRRLVPHWVSFAALFLVLALPHVLTSGFGTTTPLRAAIAIALIALLWYGARRRDQWFQQQDELNQRLHLESLASAFVGAFLLFVTYWLLQLSGLFPPLNSLYFVLIMISLRNLGADGALQRLLSRKSTE